MDINVSALAKHFSDEDTARELLESWRWPNGVACPHCGGTEPYKLTPKATSKRPGRKGLYKCRACRKQFTVTVGTVFEDSRIPISKWLLGLHLMGSSKKGISAHQLHRNLGISYKAAWFMAHRMRYAMSSGPLFDLLKGVVESDEAYIGGTQKSPKGRSPRQKKTAVVALVERGGRVIAKPVERVTSFNIGKIISKHVAHNAVLMTDEHPTYKAVAFEQSLKHESVNHDREEYVRGRAHTNTVEGFFSLLKRGINGTFHHVSKGHLHRYCDEFAFRYSNRIALGVDDAERTKRLVRGAEGKRLTYKQPAGSSAA